MNNKQNVYYKYYKYKYKYLENTRKLNIGGGRNRSKSDSTSKPKPKPTIFQDTLQRVHSEGTTNNNTDAVIVNLNTDYLIDELLDSITDLIKIIIKNIPGEYTVHTHSKEIRIKDEHFHTFFGLVDIDDAVLLNNLKPYLLELNLSEQIITLLMDDAKFFLEEIKSELASEEINSFEHQELEKKWLRGMNYTFYAMYYNIFNEPLRLRQHVAFILEGHIAIYLYQKLKKTNYYLRDWSFPKIAGSSHLRRETKSDGNLGIDIDLLLPLNYQHIHFFQYRETHLFIKPENHGTRGLAQLQHLQDYFNSTPTEDKLTEKKIGKDTQFYRDINASYNNFIAQLEVYLSKSRISLDYIISKNQIIKKTFDEINYLGEIKQIMATILKIILDLH